MPQQRETRSPSLRSLHRLPLLHVHSISQLSVLKVASHCLQCIVNVEKASNEGDPQSSDLKLSMALGSPIFDLTPPASTLRTQQAAFCNYWYLQHYYYHYYLHYCCCSTAALPLLSVKNNRFIIYCFQRGRHQVLVMLQRHLQYQYECRFDGLPAYLPELVFCFLPSNNNVATTTKLSLSRLKRHGIVISVEAH